MKKLICILSIMLMFFTSCEKPKLTQKETDPDLQCKACKGYGEIVIEDDFLIFFKSYRTQTCHVCFGKGKKFTVPTIEPLQPLNPDTDGGYESDYDDYPKYDDYQEQPRTMTCYACHGATTCAICYGGGLVYRYGEYVDCPSCGGSGWCSECDAKGYIEL